jgi:carboxypeptidase C (cathepsin A)
VVQKNVTTLIWAGDADFICNWMANHQTANNLKYSGHEKFKALELEPYTVHGKRKGSFKSADNLSFLRAFDAGHTVMAFRK